MSDSIGLTIEQVVKSVEFFPDYHLPRGVLFETTNEKQIIKTYRYYYKGLRVWFDHLVLKQSLAPEAILTDWKYYQPHAQIYAAYLNLATGVHPRSFLAEHFESPLQAWVSLVYLQCNQALSNSGLLGLPVIQSKVESTSHNLERLKQFDERMITSIPPANHTAIKSTVFWHESPEDYLTILASDIAKQDPDFDTDYWVPYRKELRRWERAVRDCNKLQSIHLLPNGKLFITGKGKTIPKQFRETKGFGRGKKQV